MTTSKRAQGIIGSVALSGVSGAVPSRVYSGAPGFRVRAQADPALAVPLTQQVPTARSLVTRSVVDKRYRVAVKAVIADAASRWTTPPASPSTTDVITLNHPCVLNDSAATPFSGSSNVFVQCLGAPLAGPSG